MKLLVTGYARHGKDSACEILSKEFGLKFISSSSSLFVAERAVRPYLKRLGLEYPTLALCYADRVNHRALWHDAILNYNTPDRARMARELFAEHDIYCGLRNREEFLEIRKQCLFDTSIWIDRSKHQPPEDASSMQIRPDDCDYFVDNNGTLDDLKRTMLDVYGHLNI